MVVCGKVIRELVDGIPHFKADVSHIGRHDDILPSLLFFLRLSAYQCFQII